MLDYAAARAVFLVVQTGSFEGAAKILNVTPSAVSQRVRALEDRIGVILIERATPCIATTHGLWLCRHIEHVGLLERDLHARFPQLDDAAPDVTLTVATNADSLSTWFLPALSEFTRDHGVLFDVALDDQDHTAEWLRKGRVLAAVTSLDKTVQGCRIKRLGSLRYRAVATPDFMNHHFAGGLTVDTLATAPAITFNQKDRLQYDWVHATFGKHISFPTHWLPSSNGFVAATLLGMGWSLNPEPLVAQHLQSGRLIELVPGAFFDVPLFWQYNRVAGDKLNALGHAVARAARQVLQQT